MTRRTGMALLEVVLVMLMIAGLLGAGLSLSSRNVGEHQEILERAIAEGICFDVLERLKEYKLSWAMPGAVAGPQASTGATTTTTADDDLYAPVEVNPAWRTLFDRVYLEQMGALGMKPVPAVTRTPDPEVPGLFKLEVEVKWKNARGFERRARAARLCYAP